jgi:malonyl-CoA decarboxylase
MVTIQGLVDVINDHYQSLDGDILKKKRFFTFLASHLGPDHQSVYENAMKVIDVYTQKRDHVTLMRSEGQLQSSLEPSYYHLLGLMSRRSGGLKLLVDMRSDLLSIIRDMRDEVSESQDVLLEFDGHFQRLLSQWFSSGFLELEQITWQSPCDIVEKVSQYEAVHSVKHWRDIKHRVGPYRRVFTFTHRNMPREPIVILHSALTDTPSSNIQVLLDRADDGNNPPSDVTTAVFYSISAAHKGLSGIELGNSLILQVVEALRKEFSTLRHFVTLSPIPGFRKWLEEHIKHVVHNPSSVDCKINRNDLKDLVNLMSHQYDNGQDDLTILQEVLSSHDWVRSDDLSQALKRPLLSACAKYLIHEKRRGYAINPVANFHIRNGASLWRLNWLANTSPNGLYQSHGIMANYQYDLSTITDNNNNYILDGKVSYSDDIAKLL